MADKIRENITPFHDPNVFNSLPDEFREIVRSIGYKHESCIPGIVEKYDRESHLATVRPLVKYTNYENDSTERPAVTVGVLRWQTGGFLIDVPVYAGDVGWIVAADRNTQNAKMMNAKIQEKDTCKVTEGKIDYGDGNQGPQTSAQPYEMHRWSYGFFIPDSWTAIKITDENYKDALLIQTVDKKGESKGRIAMSPKGEVEIQSDKRFLINAATDIYGEGLGVWKKEDAETGEKTGGNLVVEGDASFKSDISVEGNAGVKGTLDVHEKGTFRSDLEVQNDADVGGGLEVHGDSKFHGEADFYDKIVVKKTITVTVESEEEGGEPSEKEVEATIVIDPADLFDEPDSEMSIREKTIVTGAEGTESGGKVLKTWKGRVLSTEGQPGEDIPLPEGGGGGDITMTGTGSSHHEGSAFKFVSASDSNVQVTVDDSGNMTIGVYYV